MCFCYTCNIPLFYFSVIDVMVELPFSRDMETEADRVGLFMAAKVSSSYGGSNKPVNISHLGRTRVMYKLPFHLKPKNSEEPLSLGVVMD